MGKKDETAQAVTVKKSTAVGAVLDYGQYAGDGLQGIGHDEMVVPFVSVLQGLSPEVEEVAGAKPGMLFNKGTQELIDGEDGFLFLPVVRQVAYVEWIPRKQGGGLAGRHEVESPAVLKAKAECAARGEDPRFSVLWTGEPDKSNELRQTYYIYGYTLAETEDGDYDVTGQALLSFTGTKIKVYKNWITPINLLKGRPPLFAHPTRVSTFKDGNSKGDFYNFKLRPAKGSLVDSLLPPDSPLLPIAHKFAQEITGGKVKMGDEGTAPQGEEIPF